MRLKIYEFSRKASTVNSLANSGRTQEVDITEVFMLPDYEYEEFVNNLDDSYYWLKDTEGCVLVECERATGSVVVKTEGYDYARYTALVEE